MPSMSFSSNPFLKFDLLQILLLSQEEFKQDCKVRTVNSQGLDFFVHFGNMHKKTSCEPPS